MFNKVKIVNSHLNYQNLVFNLEDGFLYASVPTQPWSEMTDIKSDVFSLRKYGKLFMVLYELLRNFASLIRQM